MHYTQDLWDGGIDQSGLRWNLRYFIYVYELNEGMGDEKKLRHVLALMREGGGESSENGKSLMSNSRVDGFSEICKILKFGEE